MSQGYPPHPALSPVGARRHWWRRVLITWSPLTQPSPPWGRGDRRAGRVGLMPSGMHIPLAVALVMVGIDVLEDVIEALGEAPAGVMTLLLAQIADVTDVVADAGWST
jgi:hypothetical protein